MRIALVDDPPVRLYQELGPEATWEIVPWEAYLPRVLSGPFDAFMVPGLLAPILADRLEPLAVEEDELLAPALSGCGVMLPAFTELQVLWLAPGVEDALPGEAMVVRRQDLPHLAAQVGFAVMAHPSEVLLDFWPYLVAERRQDPTGTLEEALARALLLYRRLLDASPVPAAEVDAARAATLMAEGRVGAAVLWTSRWEGLAGRAVAVEDAVATSWGFAVPRGHAEARALLERLTGRAMDRLLAERYAVPVRRAHLDVAALERSGRGTALQVGLAKAAEVPVGLVARAEELTALLLAALASPGEGGRAFAARLSVVLDEPSGVPTPTGRPRE